MTTFPSRAIRATAFCLLIAAASLAGCDKLPSLKETTDDPASTPSAPPPGADLAAQQATPAPPPSAPTPPPKTPQQIVEEFLATEPRMVTNQDLEKVSGLADDLDAITSLSVDGSRVTDGGMRFIDRFKDLESLNLSGTHITPAGLEGLASLPKLKTLALNDMRNIDAAGFVPVGKCAGLTELSLQSSIAGEGTFDQLKDLKELQVLRVGGSTNMLGMDFTKLVEQGAFPELRELHAGQSRLVFYGLRNLDRLKHLEVLDASGPDTTDAHLGAVEKCIKIKRLLLANSKVSGAGLAGLSKLRQLEELNLSGCPGINDAALPALKPFKQLKKLSLDGTGCTAAGVKAFKEKWLPNTVIRFGGHDV